MIKFLLKIPGVIIGSLCWLVVGFAVVVLFFGAGLCVLMQMAYEAVQKLFSLGGGNEGV